MTGAPPFAWKLPGTDPARGVPRQIFDLLRRVLSGGPRVRCPLCAWEPKAESRWWCVRECGHSWNTFDTAGRCPQCRKQWDVTQCHQCHQFSAHLTWYADGQPGRPPW